MSFLDFSRNQNKESLLAHKPGYQPPHQSLNETKDHTISFSQTIDQSSSRKQKCACFLKIRGIVLMLIGVFFLDVARFFVKLSYQDQPALTPIQNALGKFGGMLIVSFLIALLSGNLKSALCDVPKFLRFRFFIRCLVFTAVSTLQGFALKQLNYATAVILSFTAPLLSPFMALCLLKEPITFCNILSLSISFCGVIVFTSPSLFGSDQAGQENTIAGILLMLLSSTLRALDVACMKSLNKIKVHQKLDGEDPDTYMQIEVDSVDDQDHHHHLEYHYDLKHMSMLSCVFYISLTATVVASLLFGFEQAVMPETKITVTTPYVAGMLLTSGALLVIGQFCYSVATKYEDVSKLALMFYFQIILAFIWQATIFHGTMDWEEILGTVIIVCTSVTVALLKILK